MSDIAPSLHANYVELTADIVIAYVSNNSVPAGSLTALLSTVHAAVSGLAKGGGGAASENKIKKATPAQIKKSITSDALISFEDGMRYKTLRRHLTLHGLNPETYRAKYGLPADYPMTAPGYSAQRSELARIFGLGRIRKRVAAPNVIAPHELVSEKSSLGLEKPKRVGRPRRTATET